jgi:hypothetical protein
MKKYRLKFGVRGGLASQEYILTNKKLAESLATDISNVLNATMEKDWYGKLPPDFTFESFQLDKNCNGKSWTSNTHFVSLERV